MMVLVMMVLAVATRLLVVMVDDVEVFVVEVEEWLGEGVELSHEEELVPWWGLVQYLVVLMQQRPR